MTVQDFIVFVDSLNVYNQQIVFVVKSINSHDK